MNLRDKEQLYWGMIAALPIAVPATTLIAAMVAGSFGLDAGGDDDLVWFAIVMFWLMFIAPFYFIFATAAFFWIFPPNGSKPHRRFLFLAPAVFTVLWSVLAAVFTLKFPDWKIIFWSAAILIAGYVYIGFAALIWRQVSSRGIWRQAV